MSLLETLKFYRIAGGIWYIFENEPHLHPGVIQVRKRNCYPHIGTAIMGTRTEMAKAIGEELILVFNRKISTGALNDAHSSHL